MKTIIFARIVFSLFSFSTSMSVFPGYQPNTQENCINLFLLLCILTRCYKCLLFVVFLLEHGAFSENPEEISGQFEGDIILTDEQANYINFQLNNRENLIQAIQYNGKVNGQWPNNEIPYVFQRKAFTEAEKTHILTQWKKIEKISKSCIRFVERKDQPDFLHVTVK